MKVAPARLALAALLVALLPACDGAGVPYTGPRDVIAFGARDPGGYGVYAIDGDGSDLRQLTSEAGPVPFVRWSPDGRRLAYVVAGAPGEAGTLRVYDFEAGASVTVSERALPGALGPALSWAGDARRLAFAEDAGGGLLRVYDVVGGALAAAGEVAGSAPDWSPSDDELVFVTPAGDLALVRPDGEELRTLLERSGPQGDPVWSPDGERIAFWSAAGDEPAGRELLVLEPGDGGPVELGPGFGAAWSPDGERLAYSRVPQRGESADLDVFLVAAEGGEPQRLTESITVDRWPSWSPDGSALVYLAEADPTSAFVCLVRLEPEERDCLPLPERLVPAAPAWSPG